MDSEAGNTKKATKFASKAFNTVMEALAKEKKESYKPLEEMDLSELPEKLAVFHDCQKNKYSIQFNKLKYFLFSHLSY